MSLLPRSHDPSFHAASTSTAAPPLQHEPALAEAKQGLLNSGATDTPLTHSLLDTMGYAHNPSPDTGTCPIANRMLYNYTGASRSLLNPHEREAIHQKAAVDSYEQAKAYIVSSLFRIKDDSFRKVACCLVADYLGTQFLSQGTPQDAPPPQPAAWPEARPDAPLPPTSEASMAWAAQPPADAPPYPDQPAADAPPQPLESELTEPQPPAPAPDSIPPSDAPGPSEQAHQEQQQQMMLDAEDAAAAPADKSAAAAVEQSVHALTQLAEAGVFAGGGGVAEAHEAHPHHPHPHHHHHHHHHHPQEQPHHPQEQPQQQAAGFASDTFINNHHAHRDLPMADAAV